MKTFLSIIRNPGSKVQFSISLWVLLTNLDSTSFFHSLPSVCLLTYLSNFTNPAHGRNFERNLFQQSRKPLSSCLCLSATPMSNMPSTGSSSRFGTGPEKRTFIGWLAAHLRAGSGATNSRTCSPPILTVSSTTATAPMMPLSRLPEIFARSV